MEGITILATEVVSLGVPFWLAPLLGCVTFIVVLATAGAISEGLDASDWRLGALFGLFVALIFFVLSVGTYKE